MTIHIRSNSNTYKHTSRNWNTCLRLQMNRKSIFISLYYDKRANKIISPYFFLKCYYLLIILKYVRIKWHWKNWAIRKSGNINHRQRKFDFDFIWKLQNTVHLSIKWYDFPVKRIFCLIYLNIFGFRKTKNI